MPSNQRGAFNAGNVYTNKSTLRGKVSENGSMISNSNLKRVASVGMFFNLAQKGNEIVGSYTNNRLQQRKFNVGMQFTKYGIGFAVNPFIGGAYMASDLGYRAIMYNIKINKKNRESEYFRELSGNSSYSGRRYRGALL